MNCKCTLTTVFASLVTTLILALILTLFGITTITLVNPIVLGVLLFIIGFVNSIISFIAYLYRANVGRCNNVKLFLLFLYSILLVVFILIGFVSFLSDAILSLFIFSIGIFLLLGIFFTQISIILTRLNNNIVE